MMSVNVVTWMWSAAHVDGPAGAVPAARFALAVRPNRPYRVSVRHMVLRGIPAWSYYSRR